MTRRLSRVRALRWLQDAVCYSSSRPPNPAPKLSVSLGCGKSSAVTRFVFDRSTTTARLRLLRPSKQTRSLSDHEAALLFRLLDQPPQRLEVHPSFGAPPRFEWQDGWCFHPGFVGSYTLSPTASRWVPARGRLVAKRVPFQYCSNVSTSVTLIAYTIRSDLGDRPMMMSPTDAVRRIDGLQQASVHQPWKGFGAKPLSTLTTYEKTRPPGVGVRRGDGGLRAGLRSG